MTLSKRAFPKDPLLHLLQQGRLCTCQTRSLGSVTVLCWVVLSLLPTARAEFVALPHIWVYRTRLWVQGAVPDGSNQQVCVEREGERGRQSERMKLK